VRRAVQRGERVQTGVRSRSVCPDWDERLELLVDGGADPGVAGDPLLELRVWHRPDTGPGGAAAPDVLIGRARLPAAAIGLAAARRERWQRQAQALERKIAEIEALPAACDPGRAAAAALRGKLAHVRGVRAEAGARQERWVRLEWAEGCRPATRAEGEEAAEVGDSGVGVRGADHGLASVHVWVGAEVSELQGNALLNHYFHPIENAAEAARLELLHRTPGVADALMTLKYAPGQVLDRASGAAAVPPGALARIVHDEGLRRGFQAALDRAPRLFSNTARAVARVPALPVRPDLHIVLTSSARLRAALAEAALFQPGAAPRLPVALHVRVTLVAGRNLPRAAKGLPDPYVRLLAVGPHDGGFPPSGEEAASAARSAMSRTKFKTQNPEWGEAGDELAVDVLDPAERLALEVWDFDQIKTLNMSSRRVSVARSDELLARVPLPAAAEVMLEGHVPEQWFPLADAHTLHPLPPPGGGDDRPPALLLRISCQPSPLSKRRAPAAAAAAPGARREQGRRVVRVREPLAAGERALSPSELSSCNLSPREPTPPRRTLREAAAFPPRRKGAEALLFEQFARFAADGKVLGAEGQASEALRKAGVAVQGDRQFLMDIPEFLAWLGHQGLSGAVSKADAAALFDAAKADAAAARTTRGEGEGGEGEGTAGTEAGGGGGEADDRQLDLDEFMAACGLLAARFDVTLLHIAHHRGEWQALQPRVEAEAEEAAEAEARRRRKDLETAFPLHRAAARGDVRMFEQCFREGRAAEERAAMQASGAGRDMPYLVFKYLKRHKDRSLRVGGKLLKRPPPPPWAQSSHNMGLVNCCDVGGWTCLHHAAARGHLAMAACLARHGFEVSRPNVKWQRAPLHLAVARNDPEMVRLLVQLGADWTSIDVGGATPLSAATEALLAQVRGASLRLGPACEALPPPPLPPPRVATRGFLDHTDVAAAEGAAEQRWGPGEADDGVSARETIEVGKLRPVLVARPHRTRMLLLGAPHLTDIVFPWHAHKRTPNTDSLSEVLAREFDTGLGGKPDPQLNDASTNFGRDPPTTVRDFRAWTRLADAAAVNIAGTSRARGGRAHLSRVEMLEAVRALFRRGGARDADVFYVAYSGHAQRYAGRWVARDGFVSFPEVVSLPPLL